MQIGDFNAQTRTLPDYVSSDSDDHIPVSPDYVVNSELSHFSKDCVSNNYGRELLDLRKASHLRAIKGRFGEDNGTSRGHSIFFLSLSWVK